MEQTIFQRIIAREIPATIEYEDDELIVIRDIAPAAPLHLLIIPKRVITSVDALTDADAPIMGRIYLVARDLARKFGVAESGYRLVTNCNHDGGQTVFHMHVHLLAGQPLGHMSTTAMSHAPAASTASPARNTTLRDIVLFLAAAIGLAIGFNAMNPKAIAWIKPEFERTEATGADIEKYLPGSTSKAVKEVIQQTPDSASTKALADAKAPSPEATAAAADQTKKIETAAGTTPASAPVAPSQQPAQPAFVPEPGVVKEIKYDMFVRLFEGTKHYLIDARGAEKFAQGHIRGAVNYYGGEIQSRIPDLLGNVPRDRVVLIYCDGGECELSHHVADVLKQFGYGPIFIYTGGWAEWTTKRK